MRPTNAMIYFNLKPKNMNYMKSIIPILFASILLAGCGAAAVVSTPIGNIDNTPLKEAPLTEAQGHHWGLLDLQKDTIPGMSVDKAYAELLVGKKGQTVIVAVIDSGIDIDHEDLNDNVWVNEDEIPNNGIDDDKNGYIDDINGWSFLGGPTEDIDKEARSAEPTRKKSDTKIPGAPAPAPHQPLAHQHSRK